MPASARNADRRCRRRGNHLEKTERSLVSLAQERERGTERLNEAEDRDYSRARARALARSHTTRNERVFSLFFFRIAVPSDDAVGARLEPDARFQRVLTLTNERRSARQGAKWRRRRRARAGRRVARARRRHRAGARRVGNLVSLREQPGSCRPKFW